MLVFSDSQMNQVGGRARLAFADSMVAHLADFSPPLFKALGAVQMREVVAFGMARATAHGFRLQGPHRLYLEMMLMLGSHFDTDPQYPWAADILADATLRDAEMRRAQALYERLMDYRREVVGPADAHAIAALRRIGTLAREPIPVNLATLAADIQMQVRLAHPRKAAYTGDAALQRLVAKGIEGAHRQALDTARGAVLVTLLMLAFGHGCGADPLYPWIASTLRDERIVDPQARAARLEKKALTWLDHVLAHFDGEAAA